MKSTFLHKVQEIILLHGKTIGKTHNIFDMKLKFMGAIIYDVNIFVRQDKADSNIINRIGRQIAGITCVMSVKAETGLG